MNKTKRKTQDQARRPPCPPSRRRPRPGQRGRRTARRRRPRRRTTGRRRRTQPPARKARQCRPDKAGRRQVHAAAGEREDRPEFGDQVPADTPRAGRRRARSAEQYIRLRVRVRGDRLTRPRQPPGGRAARPDAGLLDAERLRDHARRPAAARRGAARSRGAALVRQPEPDPRRDGHHITDRDDLRVHGAGAGPRGDSRDDPESRCGCTGSRRRRGPTGSAPSRWPCSSRARSGRSPSSSACPSRSCRRRSRRAEGGPRRPDRAG